MFVSQGRKGNNSVIYYILTLLICISGVGTIHGLLYDNFSFNVEDSNQILILAIIPFAAVVLFIAVNTKLLHKRTVASLFNVVNNFRFSRFIISFAIWFVLLIVFEAITLYAFNAQYEFTFKKESFLALCVISLGLIPIQTLAEELLFRSYILQGLSNIFTKSIFPIILCSVIFMGAHIMNPETERYGAILMCSYYLASGLFLAIITFLDNGIEQSYGIHTATNIYGAVLVSYESAALKTDAMWTLQNPTGIMIVTGSIIAMIIYYFISKRIFKINEIGYLLEEYKEDDKIVEA
ncbi:MAG: CPBP family intramembrane metalloprotease [Saprospiraceae bacterium]|nr:CPBP family intramembrane metalloprotease [Saprospiraceae bacterium]